MSFSERIRKEDFLKRFDALETMYTEIIAHNSKAYLNECRDVQHLHFFTPCPITISGIITSFSSWDGRSSPSLRSNIVEAVRSGEFESRTTSNSFHNCTELTLYVKPSSPTLTTILILSRLLWRVEWPFEADVGRLIQSELARLTKC